MKKLLLLGFAFVISICTINTNAQSIQSVSITSPILCFGDLAAINIQVNQTAPATVLKVIVGYDIFGTFIPITSTNNTTVTNIDIPGLAAQTYTIRIVDSLTYYATNPDGSDPNSIYDFTTLNITQPLQITNTAVQNSILFCNSDCDAQAIINVFGGTPPYSISFASGPSTVISS